ncbi:hypothetical protein CSUI_007727 [Cystoisospora suis]|uniref:Transmembrane protein n=1 Tax=Cystoisospora suis TaxID=483139 RepID=A0A2C6JT75_9APIC|nr:hypothetical protein CSUI_007727 [Cystoisospora suis]
MPDPRLRGLLLLFCASGYPLLKYATTCIPTVSGLSVERYQGLLSRPFDEAIFLSEADGDVSADPSWLQVGVGEEKESEGSAMESEEEERRGGSMGASEGPGERNASKDEEGSLGVDTDASAEKQGMKGDPGADNPGRSDDASDLPSEEAEQSDQAHGEDQDEEGGSQIDRSQVESARANRQDKTTDKPPAGASETGSPQGARDTGSELEDFTDNQPSSNERSKAGTEGGRPEASRDTTAEKTRQHGQGNEVGTDSSRRSSNYNGDSEDGTLEKSEQEDVQAADSRTVVESGAGSKGSQDFEGYGSEPGEPGEVSAEAQEPVPSEDAPGKKPASNRTASAESAEELDEHEENGQSRWKEDTEKFSRGGTEGKKGRSRSTVVQEDDHSYASSRERPSQQKRQRRASEPAASRPGKKSESWKTPSSTPTSENAPHVGYTSAQAVCVRAGCKRVTSSSGGGSNGLTGCVATVACSDCTGADTESPQARCRGWRLADAKELVLANGIFRVAKGTATAGEELLIRIAWDRQHIVGSNHCSPDLKQVASIFRKKGNPGSAGLYRMASVQMIAELSGSAKRSPGGTTDSASTSLVFSLHFPDKSSRVTIATLPPALQPVCPADEATLGPTPLASNTRELMFAGSWFSFLSYGPATLPTADFVLKVLCKNDDCKREKITGCVRILCPITLPEVEEKLFEAIIQSSPQPPQAAILTGHSSYSAAPIGGRLAVPPPNQFGWSRRQPPVLHGVRPLGMGFHHRFFLRPWQH